MIYKLLKNGWIEYTENGIIHQFDPDVVVNQEYLDWLAEGNVPEPPPEPTQEDVVREEELNLAIPVAHQWIANHPAVVDFIRLRPDEQASQIETMTLAQLREVIKFLAVIVSVEIKRRFL